MKDNQSAQTGLEFPVIADTADPDRRIQFVPGVDMIAAHKRAMKARDAGGGWRGEEKPLVSFFAADPTVASASGENGMPPGLPVTTVKSKAFNAADYLRPTKQVSDDDAEVDEPNQEGNAFGSRFQRFFVGPATSPTSPAGPSAANRCSTGVEKKRQHDPPPAQSPSEAASQSTSSYLDVQDGTSGTKVDDHMAKLMGLLSNKVAILNAAVELTSFVGS